MSVWDRIRRALTLPTRPRVRERLLERLANARAAAHVEPDSVSPVETAVLPPPAPPPDLVPGERWERISVEDAGMDRAALDRLSRAAAGNLCIIRHGKLVDYTYGDVFSQYNNWASVCRTFLMVVWGLWLYGDRAAKLEQPVSALPSAAARRLDASILLKHLLSYTSLYAPPGSRWAYSCGSHWPAQHRILEDLYEMSVADILRQLLFPVLGGSTFDARMTSDDNTMRVWGSSADMARLGLLLLRNGRWGADQVLDPSFVQRAVGGGPDGDGRPNPLEGYQVHLVKGGRHSEGPMPGVPDDAYFAYGAVDRGVVAVVPSLDLVVARWTSSHGYPVESFLGSICQAVRT